MLCKRQTRARRTEDKQQRQDDILAAALRLFDLRPYNSIRMDDIAREAGLAKGTLYLYFATKEEVFLALETIEIGAWLDEATLALDAIGTQVPPELFVRFFLAGILGRPRLLRLLSLLHAVLEQNASAASITRFKLDLRQRFDRAAPLLEQRLGLPASDGLSLLLHLYSLLIGLWQVAVPTPAVQAVLESHEDLAIFRLDFAREFERAATALLRGWLPPRQPE
jgi:TetR/AcrR family transcriptional regulator